VLDEARGDDGVDAFGDGVLTTAGGIACTDAKEKVCNRAVAIVEDGNLLGEVVAALHVGGEDEAGGA
jgi:hypothetical protein